MLELRAITAGYDHRTPVVRDATLTVQPGEAVGLLGPNGCGSRPWPGSPRSCTARTPRSWSATAARSGTGATVPRVSNAPLSASSSRGPGCPRILDCDSGT